MTSEALMIQADGLGRSFPSGDVVIHALSDVGVSVAPGEFLILLGPSGCGKSTLLQIMAGLEAPSSGAIDFPAAAGGHGKLTSMVFQDYALFPWRTVLGNVAFGPEVRGVPRRRSRRLPVAWAVTHVHHQCP